MKKVPPEDRGVEQPTVVGGSPVIPSGNDCDIAIEHLPLQNCGSLL